jgi:CheY-like chemotaxis protein
VGEIGILILDDNAESCKALHHLLDSEGWRVHFASQPREAMSALASGAWNLAIANVELATPGSQLFTILGDLAHAEGVTAAPDPLALTRAIKTAAQAPQKKRLRVLFVVPSNIAPEAVPILEHEELPYSIRPYHLRDFFDKISDLLVEAGAIAGSTGERFEFAGRDANRLRKPGRDSKLPSMFASRSDYQMTEEEITEYEREEEEQKRKKSRKEEDRNRW